MMRKMASFQKKFDGLEFDVDVVVVDDDDYDGDGDDGDEVVVGVVQLLLSWCSS